MEFCYVAVIVTEEMWRHEDHLWCMQRSRCCCTFNICAYVCIFH